MNENGKAIEFFILLSNQSMFWGILPMIRPSAAENEWIIIRKINIQHYSNDSQILYSYQAHFPPFIQM